MESMTVLLTPGGGPGILAQLTALKTSSRYRCRAVLADANPASGNLFLPEVDAAYYLPCFDSTDYLPDLIRLIGREGVAVMYSGLDEEMPILARHRDQLKAAGCKLVLPPASALENALDKARMHTVLAGSVRMPCTWTVNDAFDADASWQALDGRIVVKVATSRGGRHVYMPEDREEYDFILQRVARLRAQGLAFLAQELIEGDEFNVSSLHDSGGRVIYAASRRKFENRRNKSTTTAAVIERNDEVIEQALTAVRVMGLTPGFNNVEIIVSRRDGKPYLIEVNGGRTAAQDMNLVAAGINVTDLLIDLAFDAPVQSLPHPREGVAILKIRKDVVVEYSDIERKVRKP
jgi:carbamoyl-phosphate synthase large subunit